MKRKDTLYPAGSFSKEVWAGAGVSVYPPNFLSCHIMHLIQNHFRTWLFSLVLAAAGLLFSQCSEALHEDPFLPDLTANTVLKLRDPASLEQFLENAGPNPSLVPVEQLREDAVVVFRCIDGDIYLLGYLHEGDTRNSFSAFEIGYWRDLKLPPNTPYTKTSFATFFPESRIQLGANPKTVKWAKGEPTDSAAAAGWKIYRYIINDPKSKTLNEYNMPEYCLHIYIDDYPQVRRIFYGFPYP